MAGAEQTTGEDCGVGLCLSDVLHGVRHHLLSDISPPGEACEVSIYRHEKCVHRHSSWRQLVDIGDIHDIMRDTEDESRIDV